MSAIYIPKPISYRLSPNDGYAIVAPYDTATAGAANYGGVAGNTSREYITIGHKYRVRQNGSVLRVKLYTDNLTNLTAVYVKVWRKNSANTYDLIGTSNNILSSLTAGQTNTVDLSTSIPTVKEGDYYGYRLEWSSGAQNLYVKTGVSNVTTYQVTNTTPSSSNYDWAAQTANSGYAVPIELYMTPPVFVAIGDSIISGYPGSHAFTDVGPIDNVYTTIPFQVARILNYTYQNMAIGGTYSSDIAGRFTADVVNLHPKFAIIEGGTNNLWNGLYVGLTTKEAFLNDFKTMLDACSANNIIPVVVTIFPRTNQPTSYAQAREQWNTSLIRLASSYSNAIIVDSDEYVGQLRVGGDTGNYWDILTEYDYDGTHMNAHGHRAIAQAIIDAVDKYYNSSPR